MIKFKSFDPSPGMSGLVHRYMLTEGFVPSEAPLVMMMVPALMEMLSFVLSNGVSTLHTNGKEIDTADAQVLGQYPTSFQVAVSGELKYLAVHIKSPGMFRLFNLPARRFTSNIATPLSELIGKEAFALCEELKAADSVEKAIERIESFLISQLSKSNAKVHKSVEPALAFIQQSKGISIMEVAIHAHTSPRMLQKIFLKQVGLSPKEYVKVTRFTQALRIIMNSESFSWKQIVHELGYFDQAHFINDFKSISGQPPKEYFAAYPTAHKFFSDY